MRMEGNLSNSTFGIESLVNLAELQAQGLVTKDKSIVDYIYFGNQNPASYRINKTPEWFKLDTLDESSNPQAHILTYQAQDVVCKPSSTMCVTS